MDSAVWIQPAAVGQGPGEGTEGEIGMTGPRTYDARSFADRRPRDPDAGDEPDFAEEHTPSATDPPNAVADDGAPDERWDNPTTV